MSETEEGISAYFERRVAEALQELERTQSTLAMDPVLAQIGDRIERAGRTGTEEIRPLLVEVLSSGRPGAFETVQFFAHRFRWKWLSEEVEHRLTAARAAHDLRSERFHQAVMEAFSDDWEDRDFFPSLT